MGKIWVYITAAFTFIVGLFFYEREKKLDAEAKLDNAETKKNDAVLEQHTADLNNQMQEDNAKAEAAKAEATSQEELLKFLNKDKS